MVSYLKQDVSEVITEGVLILVVVEDGLLQIVKNGTKVILLS